MDDLKTIILKMFRNSEFYGYEAHKRLMAEGIARDSSRLYRILNEMVKEDLLEGRWEKSPRGPRMRVYRLGEEGEKVLDKTFREAIQTIHYFYDEYIQELHDEPFNTITELITGNLENQNTIVYVTLHSPHKQGILPGLRRKLPKAKIYLVKPTSVAVDLKLDGLVFLDGSFTSIPLRDDFADLIVISGFPEKDCIEKALREWSRTLNPSGRLAIVIPTINVKKYEGSLGIGDFMMKYESETIMKGEHLDSEFIKRGMRKYFYRVKEKQVIHLTIFLASKRLQYARLTMK